MQTTFRIIGSDSKKTLRDKPSSKANWFDLKFDWLRETETKQSVGLTGMHSGRQRRIRKSRKRLTGQVVIGFWV